MTSLAKSVALETLRRARQQANIGNVGEIDILLDRAKARIRQRYQASRLIDPNTFQAEDIDGEYDRHSHASKGCKVLFKDVIGSKDIVAKLEGYVQLAHSLKERNLNPQQEIPLNFLFRGPLGIFVPLNVCLGR